MAAYKLAADKPVPHRQVLVRVLVEVPAQVLVLAVAQVPVLRIQALPLFPLLLYSLLLLCSLSVFHFPTLADC